MKTTSELASFVLSIDADTVPSRVVTAAETVLLDHIGAGMYGSLQPWSKLVADHAFRETDGVTGKVPLYGRKEKLPAGHAARVNGTASHGFELDDIFEPGSIHPAAVVIPAAFAAAIDRGATGRQLLSAIIAGYETIGRLTLAAASQLTPFHTTGTHGIFGATAAVAKIAGFDADQLVNAFGITGSFASAIKAFQTGGGEIKRLHGGRAAENALFAVSLAEAGLTGPRDVLENDRGFFAAFGGASPQPEGIAEPHDEWVVEQVYFKQYASCGVTHPVINSVKDVLAQREIAPDDVDHVVVRTSRRGLQNVVPNPADTMSVQYSLESAVALALLGTADDPSSFVYDNYVHSPAPALASKVEVRVDPQPDNAYPTHLAGGADVTLKSGETVSAYVPGLRELPDPDERRQAVLEKFAMVTRGLLTETGQAEVIDLVGRLASGGSAAELAELIGPRSQAAAR